MRHWCGAAVAVAVAATPAAARDIVVKDQSEFGAATKAVQPGDRILLGDGEWRDFAIRFVADGTKDKPILLGAQHAGKALLTGKSSLAVAGKFIVVANLVFKDGYAAGKDGVIATRVGNKWLENSRLTGLVIDNFTNPDRKFEDHWVSLYGAGIRVDHSQFVGKANAGAMLVVIRDQPWPLANHIRIDHNWFGPRPVLGANGGETIRIGTSTESLSDSITTVEDNWFERCDGEVEIVSVKSGKNVIRGNVFDSSQGSVVLRHGHGNLVERNVFLGHGLPHTGGVRVINERQIVRGNYMEGLAGTDFTSALVVMNGVPNSPLNRYFQVKQATIDHNSLIDVARVTLGAGASEERSAAPVDVKLTGNLITGRDGMDPFRAEASVAGIAFAGNAGTATTAAGVTIDAREVKLARAANGLLYPTDPKLAELGAPHDLNPVKRAETGVAWYPKLLEPTPALAGATARDVPVADAAGLSRAVDTGRAGDVIRLKAGTYRVAAPLTVSKPLVIAGHDATLTFAGATLFALENGGRLELRGLSISGAASPQQPGNAVIRTSAQPMTANYAIRLIDCTFADMGAPGFDVIATTPSTLADLIELRRSRFRDVAGAVLAGRSETGQLGYYNAEHVVIADSRFDRVGTVVDLLRAGTDESTYGPHFAMTGSTVTDSGPVMLWGVQETNIDGNTFISSKGIAVTHSVGTPLTRITGNRFVRTPAPTVTELDYRGPERAVLTPNDIAG